MSWFSLFYFLVEEKIRWGEGVYEEKAIDRVTGTSDKVYSE